MQEEQRKYAEKLQRDNPNAEVLELSHDATHEPWSVRDLNNVFENIVGRIFSDFSDTDSDFTVRKTLITDDKCILKFQRDHPRLYYVLTDRKLMADRKYRSTICNMLRVRAEIECGRCPGDERGDAVATQAIMNSLGAGTQ